MSENVIAKQLPAVYQRRMLMAQKDKKRNYRSNGNREYKSDVISMMLQIPEYELDVYNAFPDLFNESAQNNDQKAGSV